jgi:hypothetical protein
MLGRVCRTFQESVIEVEFCGFTVIPLAEVADGWNWATAFVKHIEMKTFMQKETQLFSCCFNLMPPPSHGSRPSGDVCSGQFWSRHATFYTDIIINLVANCRAVVREDELAEYAYTRKFEVVRQNPFPPLISALNIVTLYASYKFNTILNCLIQNAPTYFLSNGVKINVQTESLPEEWCLLGCYAVWLL